MVEATEDEAAANRRRPYDKAMAALEEFKASSGRCDDSLLAAMKASLANLEEDVSSWHSMAKGSSLGFMRQYAQQAKDRHTEAAFAIADETLAHHCLDVADAVYRGLIDFYVGSSYSGMRERARIGIDDVRAARQATSHPGTEGGPCYGNGTCDEGLGCSDSSLCETQAASPGTVGAACYGNGTCNAGLDCDAGTRLCEPASEETDQ